MLPPFKLLYGTAQRRISRQRISLTLGGQGGQANAQHDFDGDVWQDVWIDPVKGALMLRPMCLYDDWYTDSTGIFVRLGLASFGLTDGVDGWTTHGTAPAGATRLQNNAGIAGTIQTVDPLAKNQGFFFSYFDYGTGSGENAVNSEFGVSNTGDGSAGVSFKARANGQIEVWKDGSPVGIYPIGGTGGSNSSNQHVDLIVLPMCRREILIYNIGKGSGVIHVFADIDENDEDPTITLGESFWCGRTDGGSIDFEVAPLRFQTSGYATSLVYTFGRAPAVGAVPEQWKNAPFAESVTDAFVYGDPSFAGSGSQVSSVSIKDESGVGAFSVDGTSTKCRVRIDLEDDGGHTPTVYGVQFAYEAETAMTDELDDDLTPYVVSAELEVPDDPGGVKLTCVLRDPLYLASQINGFLTAENRPCQLWLGDVLVLDGVTMPVKFTDAEHDGVMRAELEIRDRMRLMQNDAFRERQAFDGFNLCKADPDSEHAPDAVRFLYKRIGLTDDELDLDDIDYKLSSVPSAKCGDYNYVAAIGSKSFDELRELQQDKASTFLWGIRPTITVPKAIFKDPDLFSTEVDQYLYRTAEDAILDGATEETADDYVYTSYDSQPLEIEANEVRCTGWDPRTGKIIQTVIEDLASKDPTIPISSQLDNHLGEDRVFALVSDRFTKQEDCDRAATYIFPQVSTRYFLDEWESQMLFDAYGVPLWRGALVSLEGRREVRISSFRVRFEATYDPDDEDSQRIVYYPATYTGGTITNAGGIGLAQIRSFHRMRAQNKVINRQSNPALGLFQVRDVTDLGS